MTFAMALPAGLLFGLGLIFSGMTSPSKVLGFLDLFGRWDPSLAFVMGGALMVSAPGFHFILKRPAALLGDAMQVPTATAIDRRLLLGGLAFGAGWGLAGYCPGPVLASLVYGGVKPALFCVAMLAGMALFEVIERVRAR